MAIQLIDALETHLQAGALIAPYAVRKNRWTDTDEQSGAEIMLIRNAGSAGQSSRLLQVRSLRLVIVASPQSVVDAQNRMEAIAAYLREPNGPAGVVRFSVPADPIGPTYTTDGRAVIELAVTVYQSGDL